MEIPPARQQAENPMPIISFTQAMNARHSFIDIHEVQQKQTRGHITSLKSYWFKLQMARNVSMTYCNNKVMWAMLTSSLNEAFF